jgi:hypothetical protein
VDYSTQPDEEGISQSRILKKNITANFFHRNKDGTIVILQCTHIPGQKIQERPYEDVLDEMAPQITKLMLAEDTYGHIKKSNEKRDSQGMVEHWIHKDWLGSCVKHLSRL